ncbi:MAG: hypothetical protein ISS47_05990 [Candidatus Omnitrophica bacterium]|nr:hypothetical protein [Candidatus Omnitrophota bacterium]
MSDNRDIGYAFFGFGFGIWSFFWGFKRLRRKKMIENIPTSTVRSLAMGLTELIGKAKKPDPIKSLITKTECVFYRYTVERYQSSGKSGRWVTVAKSDSGDCTFLLNDGTGNVAVLPKGAEFIMPVDYEFRTGLGRPLPADLQVFLDSINVRYKALIGNYAMRFKEWYIRPNEDIYVLGTARKVRDSLNTNKKRLMERIEALKNDPKKMAQVDANKDGNISMEEWGAAVARIEQDLLEQELKSSQTDELADVVIGKGDTEKTFIISDHSQKELTKKLAAQSLLGVFGGAALTLAMLWYLLLRLNIF